MNYFARESLARHLLWGAIAAVCIVVAIKIQTSFPLLAAAAALGALVAFRGCPMCWTIGLIEVLARRRRPET